MITNELLKEKYRVQKELSKKANHNLIKYEENASRILEELEKKYNIKFKYKENIENTIHGIKMGAKIILPAHGKPFFVESLKLNMNKF